MESVQVKNISHRSHNTENRTHLKFTDEKGCSRFGRVLPFSVDRTRLNDLYQKAAGAHGTIIPDGYSVLHDGSVCISIKASGLNLLDSKVSLSRLAAGLESLTAVGLHHLSIDANSVFTGQDRSVKLVFWGDGLLKLNPAVPPEVKSGGFAGPESDLYMMARTALLRKWLKDSKDIQKAETLLKGKYSQRCEAAASLGFPNMNMEFTAGIKSLSNSSFTVIRGGTWQRRDAEVNSIVSTACGMGWGCRIVRLASGEEGRPLPDMPVGTVTSSPEELLQNAFTGKVGIERLLVLCDVSQDQEDLCALINQLTGVQPPGLHLILSGSEPPYFRGTGIIDLQGNTTQARDHPIPLQSTGSFWRNAGPSWYGPRCRWEVSETTDVSSVDLSSETLFKEGACRWVVSDRNQNETPPGVKAECFYKLGRNNEALAQLPATQRTMRIQILSALGRFTEAEALLEESDEPGLKATVFKGLGQISRALQNLSDSTNPGDLPELAALYDLAGIPAYGLKPLTNGLENASEMEKAEILCSLRNLEMRLGFYSEAFSHAEQAVGIARKTGGVRNLVHSLQARGRTLLVLGRWREAEVDFITAANLCRDNALAIKRPVQIDLFDLQLRMGQLRQARETLADLERITPQGGVPARQMLYMLKANMGMHLGNGEKSLPDALKAQEIAEAHGMELYSSISTLYAGVLYLQAGMYRRGIELLNKARSAGHVLGDKHLVCLAEIELLLSDSLKTPILSMNLESENALSEEQLILKILQGKQVDSCFQQLLLLPSPLTVCRLADRAGFPESSELAEEIFKARDNILSQMNSSEQKVFLQHFARDWDKERKESRNRIDYSDVLKKISTWIAEYSEGITDLDSLKHILQLDRISLHPGRGLMEVSRKWPFYVAGGNAHDLLPLLLPVAAVVSTTRTHVVDLVQSRDSSFGLLGESPAIKKIRFEIQRFAAEDIPVLITGETGTGKEICAREIHRHSNRQDKAFLPVDCGAIPENLLESEFFGASAGAYTGITSSRKGILEEADGGTLFLDELGNLPLHMQAKLLRVFDSGVFRRLGETKERRTDLRIIAASNSNLDDLLENGLFRTDLFYRLAVVRIHMPPLRERPTDLQLLATHFSGKTVSSAALAALQEHSWPGNVRELQNVMKRAAINSGDSPIRQCDISITSKGDDESATLSLQEAMRKHVKKTVDLLGGNRSKAARALGCDPKTLRKYLNQ